ncbi:MAG: hypothetical protein Q7S00_07010, partial [bacterium]|nr:hypothetical protein [bacterium]
KERIQKRELLNVSLVWGNARFAIPELFTEGQLEEIYIFHPDPWPKTRHSKHRLLQTSFLNDLAVRMAPGGLLYIQTDDPPYSVEIQEALNKTVSLSPAEIMLNRSTRTLYEEKMKGKPLFTFKYRRC